MFYKQAHKTAIAIFLVITFATDLQAFAPIRMSINFSNSDPIECTGLIVLILHVFYAPRMREASGSGAGFYYSSRYKLIIVNY